MANPEHVTLLRQGQEVWDDWRESESEILPDLSSVDLSGADLFGFDLRQANLSGANLDRVILQDALLSGADLSGANLSGANLGLASLEDAKMSSANLSGASLWNAFLSGADLSGADLSDANLRDANLSIANLSNADLSYAKLSNTYLNSTTIHAVRLNATIFAWVDLCAVEGLDTVIHDGPSTVNINTVKLPEGETRIRFLQGAGFSDAFIDYLPALLTAAIQYNSCFISYAHQDEALARRLHKDLQGKGVRCWFAPEDLKIGNKFRQRIDEAIHLQDKLLLLLSEHSITSTWVENEVEAALEKEDRQQREILFPVRLDDAVMHTSQAWAATLRRMRHIGNFTNWQDDATYQQRFTKLLSHLKVKRT